MIIKPRIRGFICTTAHPAGCAASVNAQIDRVRELGAVDASIRKVLVLGASGGYGLASRITAAFGCGADTLGVSFEKPPSEGKTATAKAAGSGSPAQEPAEVAPAAARRRKSA